MHALVQHGARDGLLAVDDFPQQMGGHAPGAEVPHVTSADSNQESSPRASSGVMRRSSLGSALRRDTGAHQQALEVVHIQGGRLDGAQHLAGTGGPAGRPPWLGVERVAAL